jgi:type II secretory pathway component PulF
MMTYIVPTLSKTFKELGVELPATTQAVIALSDFLQNNTLAFFGVLILGIALIVMFFKSKSGVQILNIALTKAPLFGELTKQINSARTARTLSSLLKAGVPYLQSMQITKQVISNHLFKNVLQQAEKKVVVSCFCWRNDCCR